ncbi:MAG: hypothetical protein RL885_19355 [Planctomycetota bacterium]
MSEQQYEERTPRLQKPAHSHRRAFDIGSVLSRSFSIWGRNLVPFVVLTVLLQLPLYAWNFFVTGSVLGTLDFPEDPTQPPPASLYGWALAGWLVTLLCTQLVTATLVYAVFKELRKQKATIGECLSQGLARLFPVIGVALVATLLPTLSMMPIIALGVFAPMLLLLLVIPAGILFMFIYCGLWVAIPAAVVERPGVFGALSRSWELTRNNRLAIFGLMVIIMIFAALLAGLLVMVTNALGQALAWVGLFANIPGISLMAVLTAVTYHDLRVSKEGIGSEELASIFD